MLLKVPFFKQPMSWAIQRVTPRELEIPEGTIIFDKDDPAMSGAITLGQYEPEMMSFFRSSLTPGMTVVDIGANLGFFTVIAAGKVGPSGKVFAYEPDPHNFDLLKKNIAVNSFTTVKASSTALSDRVGTRELFFGDNNTTHSFGDKRGAGRSETVSTDTLDNSLKQYGSPQIDLIKMDIEGAEPIALEGMLDTIKKNPNLILLFEFHPNAIKRVGHSPLGLLKRLTELGFSLSVIDEDKKVRTPINDCVAFTESFQGKEMSRNLIAVKAV
jgi:FkbM family methyltransferase